MLFRSFRKAEKGKLKAKWLDGASGNVKIEVDAKDRVGLLADIINTIGTTGTNIVSAKAKTIGKESVKDEFILTIDSLDHFKAVIKKLIATENRKKPLSDSKIAALIAAQGIQVARRTVAKYREALGIAPSNERKAIRC